MVGSKLYVSNEGGRAARSGDLTINSYGTQVPANPVTGASTTGTVSVIDTANPAVPVGSIRVGLHPTALYLAGTTLFVANTSDDSVSVIDTGSDKVVQTIETRPWPTSKVGYEPTGIALTDDGHLLVSLGRANAIAVYRYAGDPLEPVSYLGLLPTDYFPAAVAVVGGKVVVTNSRGIDARGPELTFSKGAGTVPAVGHGTHSTTASLTRFTLPSDTADRGGHLGRVHAERLDAGIGAAREPDQGRGCARAAPDRRSVDHQARFPAGQGEPDLRPGLRRRRRAATGTPRSTSSARRSPRTSTRWPSSSGSTTTPTTSAPTPPRATTG